MWFIQKSILLSLWKMFSLAEKFKKLNGGVSFIIFHEHILQNFVKVSPLIDRKSITFDRRWTLYTWSFNYLTILMDMLHYNRHFSVDRPYIIDFASHDFQWNYIKKHMYINWIYVYFTYILTVSQYTS